MIYSIISVIFIMQWSYINETIISHQHMTQRLFIVLILYLNILPLDINSDFSILLCISYWKYCYFEVMNTNINAQYKNEKRNQRENNKGISRTKVGILRNSTYRQHNIFRLRIIFKKVLMPSIILRNLSILPTNVQASIL